MKKDQSTYWIIGAGKFGVRAAEKLCRKRPEARFIVVDEDLEALKRLSHLPVEKVCQEGAAYLQAYLDTELSPTWIIPAVPIHLAFEWVRLKMLDHAPIHVVPVPSEIASMLPNPLRGPNGQLYVSYADFLCPEHCMEPLEKCTVTGKPRKGLLYKTLEEILYEDATSVVIRSHQLAPGVGGYGPEALKESFGKISQGKGLVLYSTACLCHGVVHAFKLLDKPEHRQD
jgi:hypothetical protein